MKGLEDGGMPGNLQCLLDDYIIVNSHTYVRAGHPWCMLPCHRDTLNPWVWQLAWPHLFHDKTAHMETTILHEKNALMLGLTCAWLWHVFMVGPLVPILSNGGSALDKRM